VKSFQTTTFRPHTLAAFCVLLFGVGLPLTAVPAVAQVEQVSSPELILTGRVVHEGTGVPGNPVALHRITSLESGEVATTTTDEDGFFQFPLQPAQGTTFTVYFATTDYLSVKFFGQPLHPDSAANVEYVLPVYDTTSVLPEPIKFAARDIFMIGDQIGGWEVLEILKIVNPTNLAYVGTEGMGPWEFRLPEGATDFQVGQADVLPHELSWIEDRVLHVTPVTPGSREAFISYRLPRGPAESTLFVGEPTDTLSVYVRQPSHLTAISGLVTTRRVSAEGEEFLQYSGLGIEPGAEVTLAWSRGEGPPVDPVIAAVALTVLLLGVGVIAAIRNRDQLS
jgi:5-hydroxyisourate hydrolase-like protein (transthyretin family)